MIFLATPLPLGTFLYQIASTSDFSLLDVSQPDHEQRLGVSLIHLVPAVLSLPVPQQLENHINPNWRTCQRIML